MSEETPGQRAERERLARRRDDDRRLDRQRRQQRRDARASQEDLDRRRSQPELRRNYEIWIRSYGTRRQREQLDQQNAVGGGPSEAEQRAWERKHANDGRWIGQPDPEPRHRQHQRRWLDDQPTTTGGLIGLPDPTPPEPEPDSGDKGWSWTAGAAEALGGSSSDPPPDDDGKNASGGDGRIPW